jgi:hypothetical protein
MKDARLNRRELLGGALAAGAGLWPGAGSAAVRNQFPAERSESAILVNGSGGKAVLRYVRRRVEGEKAPSVEGACYTYPIYTPAGELVADLAPSDHPHHRGVFCGWVELQGELRGDWWGWGAKAPKEGRLILNREASVTEAGKRTTLRLVNSWRAEGLSVLEEVLTLTVSAGPSCHVLDYDYQFTPPTATPVVIAQSPFGGFCYRAMPGGKLVVSGPEGPLDRPDSVSGKPELNWPASAWYDLTYTTADGTASGVALIDHPANPRSTWHVVRSLHMLNPCIVSQAPFSLTSRAPLRLRYRLVAHDGPPQPEELGRLVESFGR